MKVKPDLSFWKLWNISFGFFGVQIAYALQSANISRIFATLGADPHNLSYFWILPPLAGIIVQPIVGAASDKTWTRFGRRIPYLFVGSQEALDRVGKAFLLFVYHVAHHHFEGLHGHIDGGVEEHQRYQSENHGCTYCHAEASGIG